MKRYLLVSLLLLLSTSFAAAASVTFRGRATVVDANVLGVGAKVSDTGNLSSSGGNKSTAVVTFDNLLGALSGTVAGASAVGAGNQTTSKASVADLNIGVGGNVISAKLLAARAEVKLVSGTPVTIGDSVIVGLKVNGQAVVVSGSPNQKVRLPNGYIIINQHYRADAASLTVIALRVVVSGVADVKISRANAGIGPCSACPPFSCNGTPSCDASLDFIVGSLSLKAATTANASLDLTVGKKSTGNWGHLVFVDADANLRAKVTAITKYEVLSSTRRRIEALAEVNGQANVKLVLEVIDNGYPDTNDVVKLNLSTGYALEARLHAGFLQIRKACN